MSWSLWKHPVADLGQSWRILGYSSPAQQSGCCFEYAGQILWVHSCAREVPQIQEKALFLQKFSWRLLLPWHSWESSHELLESDSFGSRLRLSFLQFGSDPVHSRGVHFCKVEHRSCSKDWLHKWNLQGAWEGDQQEDRKHYEVISSPNFGSVQGFFAFDFSLNAKRFNWLPVTLPLLKWQLKDCLHFQKSA